MAWDPVPWCVGGGAVHSSEVGRLVTYIATGGRQGVLSPTDLMVQPLVVPGQGVRVAPGACVIVNKALNVHNDSYVARLPAEDTVATSPTAGTGRSDLVIARIENPFISGEPWGVPVDVTAGPYVFTRIVQNVPNTTKSVDTLGLGYTAIPLARIDIPPSTGTITAGMIKDLRTVCNPAAMSAFSAPDADDTDGGEPRAYLFLNIPSTKPIGDITDSLLWTENSFTDFPADATWTMRIPPWATHLEFDLSVNNVRLENGDATGETQLLVNGVAAKTMIFDFNKFASNPIRVNMPIGGTYVIPPAIRGTKVTAKVQARWYSGDPRYTNGIIVADQGSYTSGSIFFQARPTLS
jgi:hypothetical protein